MSTSVKFSKCIAAQQSAFNTPASSGHFQLPFVGEYEDLQEEHAADWDAGTWTPTVIVEKVANMARVTLNGVLFFELLPIIHNMCWDNEDAADASTYFEYDNAVSPSAVGSILPYTFWLGANEAIGGTGPMVRIADCFVESYTLTANINSKEIQVSVTLVGAAVDDNSGAGFAAPTAALPTLLGMAKTLLGQLNYQDATSTGGDFATMTALSGALLDWSYTFNSGLVPLWSADNNSLTLSGARLSDAGPSVEFSPMIRTNATTYAAVKGKAESRTYQEVQHILNGSDQRQLKYNMTGRFLPNFIAHGRNDGEVVMQPTFRVETPHTQTTTPHWLSWELDTEWEHS